MSLLPLVALFLVAQATTYTGVYSTVYAYTGSNCDATTLFSKVSTAVATGGTCTPLGCCPFGICILGTIIQCENAPTADFPSGFSTVTYDGNNCNGTVTAKTALTGACHASVLGGGTYTALTCNGQGQYCTSVGTSATCAGTPSCGNTIGACITSIFGGSTQIAGACGFGTLNTTLVAALVLTASTYNGVGYTVSTIVYTTQATATSAGTITVTVTLTGSTTAQQASALIIAKIYIQAPTLNTGSCRGTCITFGTSSKKRIGDEEMSTITLNVASNYQGTGSGSSLVASFSAVLVAVVFALMA